MGLRKIIADAILKSKLNNLYRQTNDAFRDITQRVSLKSLEKSLGIAILQSVCLSGRRDYKKLKENNSNQTFFEERDKDFYSLFDEIDSIIQRYTNELYSL